MGTFLTVLFYSAYVFFLGRIAWRFFLLAGSQKQMQSEAASEARLSILILIKTAADILFLSRLFKINRWLWLGEWLFHVTFMFVLIWHLRYIMNPVPDWLTSYRHFGIYSGYILPLALLSVFVFKIKAKSAGYVSGYNFFILSLLLLISVTGIFMKTVAKPDVASVKYFMLGTLSFKPAPAPESMMFLIHFITSLILIAYIPSHMFAAPYTMMEARKRDDELKLVQNGK